MNPTITAIPNESTSLPKRSRKTFHCRNLFVFPIMFAILVHLGSNLFNSSQETKLLPIEFGYLFFLFQFPLLSTTLIFTVACYYNSKPVSAIPCSVFKRLFITYLWVSTTMVIYNSAFVGCFVLCEVAKVTKNAELLWVLAFFLEICLILADDVSLCQLAGRVSGLEPVYGFAAMEKCCVLLKARNPTAVWLVFTYLLVYRSIGGVFGSLEVHGGLDYGVIVVLGHFVVWLVVSILMVFHILVVASAHL